MAKYSKAHERDENSKMWKGFWHSTFGILFCWVPLLGLIMSISGFARQVVRMTAKHRLKMTLLILYGLVSLTITIGAICGGLYLYSRNPYIFSEWGDKIWVLITTGEVPASDGSEPEMGISDDGAMMDDFGAYDFGPDIMADDYEPEPIPDHEFMLQEEAEAEARIGDMLEEEEGAPLDAANELLDEDDLPLAEDDELMELDEEDDFADGDEEPDPIDFGYEVVDETLSDKDGLSHIEYKVAVDKFDPTAEDLSNVFDEIVSYDGYELHTMLVYRQGDDHAGEYTVAKLVQFDPGQAPSIEQN